MDDFDVGPFIKELAGKAINNFDDMEYSDGRIQLFISFKIVSQSLCLGVFKNDAIDISAIMEEYWKTNNNDKPFDTPQSIF
jgi:hypothetical protein